MFKSTTNEDTTRRYIKSVSYELSPTETVELNELPFVLKRHVKTEEELNVLDPIIVKITFHDWTRLKPIEIPTKPKIE